MHSILLIAYQCGPGMGSVSQIGWDWFVRLSSQYEVTLVTHLRNRAAIEEALMQMQNGATSVQQPLPHANIMYIDSEWFAGPLYRLAKRLFPNSEHSVFFLSSLDYFLFDLLSFRQLKKALDADNTLSNAANKQWHLIHRVTPVTSAAPTLLGYLGLPILLGPLNCGLGMPQGFADILQQESLWLTPLRRLSPVLDYCVGSSRHITRFLTANRSTKNSIAKAHQARCHFLPENTVNTEIFRACPWPPTPSSRHPLRVLFVGRLIALKGLDMLLQACANLVRRGYAIHLDIVGDGPLGDKWQALAQQLRIEQHCSFYGQQPASMVAQFMAACHVFCLPSIRESAGAVLLEAMACARPVIALNFGGPAEVVDSQTGALLAMESPSQVITDLTTSLADVIADPASWAIRGKRGQQLIQAQYSWPAKMAVVARHYAEILAAPSKALKAGHV